MEIEPRGKVYDWYGGKAWIRVINGKVFHFQLDPPSDYWNLPTQCKVRSHRYGHIEEMVTVHKAIAFDDRPHKEHT